MLRRVGDGGTVGLAMMPLAGHVRRPEQDQVAVPAVFGPDVQIAEEAERSEAWEQPGDAALVFEQHGVVDLVAQAAEEPDGGDVARPEQGAAVGHCEELAPAPGGVFADAGTVDVRSPGERDLPLEREHTGRDGSVTCGLLGIGEGTAGQQLPQREHDRDTPDAPPRASDRLLVAAVSPSRDSPAHDVPRGAPAANHAAVPAGRCYAAGTARTGPGRRPGGCRR